MILLRSYPDYISANTAKFVLENEGILTFLWDENAITINSINHGSIGSIKLMISEADYDRAIQILEDNENTATD